MWEWKWKWMGDEVLAVPVPVRVAVITDQRWAIRSPDLGRMRHLSQSGGG